MKTPLKSEPLSSKSMAFLLQNSVFMRVRELFVFKFKLDRKIKKVENRK